MKIDAREGLALRTGYDDCKTVPAGYHGVVKACFVETFALLGDCSITYFEA